MAEETCETFLFEYWGPFLVDKTQCPNKQELVLKAAVDCGCPPIITRICRACYPNLDPLGTCARCGAVNTRTSISEPVEIK